ncbi:MAG TPA: hypothetical protein VEL03_15210 [Streptosporangiaceae bacterium]|nr:hypothetical protein [Streptosporangiaceae bacterium]
MVINFQTVQETLVALATIVGIVIVFVGATLLAAAAVRRDRKRHARAHVLSGPAQQPTQTDKVLELASR